MDDTENLSSPSCSNQDDFDFSLSSPPKSVEKTSKFEENTAKLEENIIVDEQDIETTCVKGDLDFVKRSLNFDTINHSYVKNKSKKWSNVFPQIVSSLE